MVWGRDRHRLLGEVLSQAQGCWVQSDSSPNQGTHQTWSASPQGGFRPEKGLPRARVSASLLSPACRVEVWEAPRSDQLPAGQFQERKGSVCGHPDSPSPSAAAGTEPGLPLLGWSHRRACQRAGTEGQPRLVSASSSSLSPSSSEVTDASLGRGHPEECAHANYATESGGPIRDAEPSDDQGTKNLGEDESLHKAEKRREEKACKGGLEASRKAVNPSSRSVDGEGRARACWETCTRGASGWCSGTVNGAGVFCARAGEEQTRGAERCFAACVDTAVGRGGVQGDARVFYPHS